MSEEKDRKHLDLEGEERKCREKGHADDILYIYQRYYSKLSPSLPDNIRCRTAVKLAELWLMQLLCREGQQVDTWLPIPGESKDE